MTYHLSHPCACSQVRIPRLQNVIVDTDGTTHRLAQCAGPRITVLPTHAPPAPRLLSVVCEHGEPLWVTGPEPEALYRELGCGCEGRAA